MSFGDREGAFFVVFSSVRLVYMSLWPALYRLNQYIVEVAMVFKAKRYNNN